MTAFLSHLCLHLHHRYLPHELDLFLQMTLSSSLALEEQQTSLTCCITRGEVSKKLWCSQTAHAQNISFRLKLVTIASSHLIHQLI